MDRAGVVLVPDASQERPPGDFGIAGVDSPGREGARAGGEEEVLARRDAEPLGRHVDRPLGLEHFLTGGRMEEPDAPLGIGHREQPGPRRSGDHPDAGLRRAAAARKRPRLPHGEAIGGERGAAPRCEEHVHDARLVADRQRRAPEEAFDRGDPGGRLGVAPDTKALHRLG